MLTVFGINAKVTLIMVRLFTLKKMRVSITARMFTSGKKSKLVSFELFVKMLAIRLLVRRIRVGEGIFRMLLHG